MSSLFDYLHDKISEESSGVIIWNGLFGAVIAVATIFLFNTVGIVDAIMSILIVFGGLIAKLAAPDVYKWIKKKVNNKKPLTKKRVIKKAT